MQEEKNLAGESTQISGGLTFFMEGCEHVQRIVQLLHVASFAKLEIRMTSCECQGALTPVLYVYENLPLYLLPE